MKPYVHLDFISINKDKQTIFFDGSIENIEGSFDIRLLECLAGDQSVKAIQTPRGLRSKVEPTFTVEIRNIQDVSEIIFLYDGSPMHIKTGMFTRIPDMFLGYRIEGDIFLRKGIKKIHIGKATARKQKWFEFTFSIRSIFYWRLDRVRNAFQNRNSGLKGVFSSFFKSVFIVAETIMYFPYNYYIRCRAIKRRKRGSSRPLWLISDRVMAAGDNGEALFRYIQNQKDCPADVRFVISKKSKDYDRISSIGPVLDADSAEYKITFLLADKIISSQADIETINPFLRQYNHVVDLFNYKFVFLQHGVTRHDMTEWLNKYNRDISLFITSGRVEYDSILRLPYGYSENNLLLSGMPRFDLLKSDPKRKIMVAPTYRNSLLVSDTGKNGQRPYNSQFNETEYFNFYNSLINDERVAGLLQKYDMTLDFYLHPVFSAQVGDFEPPSDRIVIKTFPYDYQQAFRESDILITDYSSVVFDFVYLKKPVVYTQFDRESFYASHTYTESDFFSDKEQGFGPIANTLDDAITELEQVLESNNKMSQEYKNRVDDFFEYTDTSNSKRVYDALVVE